MCHTDWIMILLQILQEATRMRVGGGERIKHYLQEEEEDGWMDACMQEKERLKFVETEKQRRATVGG